MALQCNDYRGTNNPVKWVSHFMTQISLLKNHYMINII